MNPRFEDAREFAGADWQRLTMNSRRTLLQRNGQKDLFAGHSWWRLPPSVKKALIAPLMKEPERARAQA